VKTDLGDYLEFVTDPAEVIRLKGTRINLEMIVRLLQEGMLPEQIRDYFVAPPGLDQVYAAVTFYLMNRKAVEDYIRRGDERAEQLRREYEAAHPESAALRNRVVQLRKQFTGADGKVDFAALRAHVQAERIGAAAPAGAG
jgi:uncharacterized protein (DUF433 family)